MTIIIEDSEEIPCSHCDQLRQTFMLIALSAVVPMVLFTAILMLTVTGELDVQVEFTTSLIVEFVFGLLYVQLFVATVLLIISFMKRKHPLPLKYHYWYFFFHTAITGLFLGATFVMTIVNSGYCLAGFVFFGGCFYFYMLYNFMETNKSVWTTLRRAY
ncbi:hypothetical protein B5X24_HaOG208393 [Helicoverpa armigera]|uniref:Uncharacterized protein n=1 Tax=Helicoverpa armigera TaxID=29058 RepID=A0A2W1BMH7_HELAM|nr:hypothetical protein B5X24_HaOG208393 [Helicoverpa armigera]